MTRARTHEGVTVCADTVKLDSTAIHPTPRLLTRRRALRKNECRQGKLLLRQTQPCPPLPVHSQRAALGSLAATRHQLLRRDRCNRGAAHNRTSPDLTLSEPAAPLRPTTRSRRQRRCRSEP